MVNNQNEFINALNSKKIFQLNADVTLDKAIKFSNKNIIINRNNKNLIFNDNGTLTFKSSNVQFENIKVQYAIKKWYSTNIYTTNSNVKLKSNIEFINTYKK